MTEQGQPKHVGLEHLSDEKLVEIVEKANVDRSGGFLSPEARIAFLELARRSGHDD